MPNESFSETLRNQLFNTRNLYTTLRITEKKDFIEIADNVIYVLDVYGGFLNSVPFEDRKKFNDEIIKFISSVHDDLRRTGESNKIRTRAIDKKKSDLKAISRVIEIVGELPADLHGGKEAYDLLNELHTAIEKDTSRQVLHRRYYRQPLTNKTAMRDIISEIVKLYNIPKAVKATDELIAALPTAKNI